MVALEGCGSTCDILQWTALSVLMDVAHQLSVSAGSGSPLLSLYPFTSRNNSSGLYVGRGEGGCVYHVQK